MRRTKAIYLLAFIVAAGSYLGYFFLRLYLAGETEAGRTVGGVRGTPRRALESM